MVQLFSGGRSPQVSLIDIPGNGVQSRFRSLDILKNVLTVIPSTLRMYLIMVNLQLAYQ
jgi:hypothetical protein